MRRMMGIVSVWDISSITDNRLRAVAESFIIRVSSRWILERASLSGIDELIGIVQEEAKSVAV
jgi:5-methylthioribose kinase